MSISFTTVRAKLIILVALPAALMLATMPVLSEALHDTLMHSADDHVEDAENALLLELDDDLREQTSALRAFESDPRVLLAMQEKDKASAAQLTLHFKEIYAGMEFILAQPDGTLLGYAAPHELPARLAEVEGFETGAPEVRALLPKGCGSRTAKTFTPARVLGHRSVLGTVVVCEPLNGLWLEHVGKKLGLQLALLLDKALSERTAGFPAQGLEPADENPWQVELKDRHWALHDFVVPGNDGLSGPELRFVAAADVTNISRGVHHNLYLLLAVIGAISAIAIAVGSRIAGVMSGALRTVIGAFRKLEHQEYVRVPVRRTRDELEWLASGFNQMVDGLIERDRLRTTFGKYMTESVLTHLLSGRVALGGETLTVTILFTDIRSFTSISEKMDAQALVGLLNEYFTEMVAIVMKHDGVVDKYIGDAIMAVFGAPVPREHDAINAVRAAVEMRSALARLNERLAERGLPPIRTGIGLHTGEVVAGNIGSEARMEYTVIGDAVNLASRLESATKDLGVDVLISQTTLDAAGPRVKVRPGKEITVKGRAAPVHTYEVTGVDEMQVETSN